jgi:hypothetical protein
LEGHSISKSFQFRILIQLFHTSTPVPNLVPEYKIVVTFLVGPQLDDSAGSQPSTKLPPSLFGAEGLSDRLDFSIHNFRSREGQPKKIHRYDQQPALPAAYLFSLLIVFFRLVESVGLNSFRDSRPTSALAD